MRTAPQLHRRCRDAGLRYDRTAALHLLTAVMRQSSSCTKPVRRGYRPHLPQSFKREVLGATNACAAEHRLLVSAGRRSASAFTRCGASIPCTVSAAPRCCGRVHCALESHLPSALTVHGMLVPSLSRSASGTEDDQIFSRLPSTYSCPSLEPPQLWVSEASNPGSFVLGLDQCIELSLAEQ